MSTLNVDLYYTMRSPYCYLATHMLRELLDSYDFQINLKPVYPLAVSDASFFERVNPLWPPYVARDTARIAKRLGIPFLWPRPDPIVQDSATRAVAADQPYIRRLTHYAQLASEADLGFEYVLAVSSLLYNPDVDGWDKGDHLARTLNGIGLDQSQLDASLDTEGERLEAAVHQNRQDQLDSGHWGAPLFVYEGEAFFGQDRLDDLIWHLQQNGLRQR